jgi:hypothetical protein
MIIGKFKRYKSRDIDQIPAELIQAGCIIVCFKMHKLINSVGSKEELPRHWSQ